MEVISGPAGTELMSFVVESGTHCLVGGSHRTSNEEMIRIPDSGMSIPHFRISNLGGAIRLSDCESKNGTVINGKRVTEQALEAGTIFQAGRSRFQVRWEQLPAELPEEILPTVPNVKNQLLSNASADVLDGPNPQHSFESQSDSASGTGSRKIETHPPSVPLKVVPNSGPTQPDNISSPNGDAANLVPGIDAANSIAQDPEAQLAEDVLDESGTEALMAEPAIRLLLPSSNLWCDFDRILRRLDIHPGLYAIAHLGKLAEFRSERHRGIALFPHLDSSGSALPAAFDGKEWMRAFHESVAQRLLGMDGLMIVLLEPSDSNVEQSLQSLGSAAIPGFNEQGGFVPWCWPTALQGVVESLSDAMIGKWLGQSIQAIIYPHRDRIVTYVQRDSVASLLELGFR